MVEEESLVKQLSLIHVCKIYNMVNEKTVAEINN